MRKPFHPTSIGLAVLVLICSIFLFSNQLPVQGQGVGKEMQKKIDKAVKKGVKYLKKRQNSNGSWTDIYHNTEVDPLKHPVGETALTLFALIESGVKPKDPVIKKGLNWLIKQEFNKTYTVSISIMAVESIFTPESERNQVAQWASGMTEDFEIKQRELSPKARKWMVRATKWLLGQMKKTGAWTYNRKGTPVRHSAVTGNSGGFVMLERARSGNNSGFRWDHSNTQYAVLGLHSASRCGILIHNRHWRQILAHWLKTQADSGPPVDVKRDGYKKEENATGFGSQAEARHWIYEAKRENRRDLFEMTCGGIGSVAIALSHLQQQGGTNDTINKKSKASIRDGLAYLQKHWDKKYPVTRGRPKGRGGFGGYYTLYGLERAMMLTTTYKLNDHNWYVEGAKALLKKQKDDGSWRGRGSRHTPGKKTEIPETCFALLFLKRATLPVTTGH